MQLPLPLHQGCTPSRFITLPTSASRCPSTTPRINGPAIEGSSAPIFRNTSVSPPKPVAKKPGEIAHTLAPSSFSQRCHSRISMFRPVLALRYAGKLSPVLGHPLAGTRFTGTIWFSVPSNVDVPEVIKSRRGSALFSSSGANVDVRICVPVTFTFQYIYSAELGLYFVECLLDRIIVLDIHLDRNKIAA